MNYCIADIEYAVPYSKQDIATLAHEISPDDFKWAVQDNRLWRFEDLEKLDEPHFETAYPFC
jgi:hypothetical protein